MDTTPDWMEPLRKFAEAAQPSTTFLSLDLDGTALLEDHGKVFLSSSVEKGVKALYDLKVPILINTLRFPLSVLNTVGQAWCQIANNPIPTVLLNGSVLGYVRCDHGELSYEEIAAYPLGTDEIQAMLGGITQLTKSGIDDLLLFFYARDWRDGETLWTPCPEKLLALKKKYVSASRVFSCRPDELASELLQREICMTSLFIDRPEDTLMAYQHSKRNSFFTARGVDKSSGLRALAARFSLDPGDSLGAGDTQMDTFLSEVGCAVIVGEARLPFRGRRQTIRVADPLKLGELIMAYADMLKLKLAA